MDLFPDRLVGGEEGEEEAVELHAFDDGDQAAFEDALDAFVLENEQADLHLDVGIPVARRLVRNPVHPQANGEPPLARVVNEEAAHHARAFLRARMEGRREEPANRDPHPWFPHHRRHAERNNDRRMERHLDRFHLMRGPQAEPMQPNPRQEDPNNELAQRGPRPRFARHMWYGARRRLQAAHGVRPGIPFVFPAAVPGGNNNDGANPDAGNGPIAMDVLPEPGMVVDRYLFDLVREDLPCAGVCGSNVRCCNLLVTSCEREPQSLSYRCASSFRTPLHEAASRCLCSHVIESFVQLNAPVSYGDVRGNTPLHLLLLGMPSKVVEPETLVRNTRLLLPPPPVVEGEPPAENPNPTGILPSNTAGDTALHLACKVPQSFVPEETVDILIVYSPESLLKLNTLRQTPLHLHCGRRNSSVGLAQKLAPEGYQFVNDSHACNPLHSAASMSNTALICWLVDFDSRLAAEVSSNERTALHLFCMQRDLPPASAVRALVSAYPEAASRRDANLATPLHLHLANARTPNDVSLELVEILAPYCSLLPDTNGFLPVHLACKAGARLSVVAKLLSVESSNARTNKGDTALSIACTANVSPATVLKLLAVNPGSAQVSNQYGFLPLHAVCRAYHPNVDMITNLVQAFPDSLTSKTNAGETPLHLAHHGASKAVLRVLNAPSKIPTELVTSKTKLGNTPLHSACFHTVVMTENIENMASGHPQWIGTKNKNGLTPLQILCRHGRINEAIVQTFYRLAGSSVFSDVDENGHTALHSAMREETDVPVIRALINSCPMALRMCTQYGDTPLHLACCRSVKAEVVAEVAQSSCARATQLGFHVSPLLLPNKGSQTPFQLAMEEYRRTGFVCPNKTDWGTAQDRCFEILVSLVKILYYGPNKSVGSLVYACVALHRKGARLDPTFIHQVIKMHPEEVREAAEEGSYPLHIEAGIPVEKFVLLDGHPCSCSGNCHKRESILKLLMDLYPDAAKKSAPLPVVKLMIQNGRRWDETFAFVVRTNPEALFLLDDRKLVPYVLGQVGRGCGIGTLYAMIRASPRYLR